ncbi:MAG: hypothetical protein E6K07_05935 [Methanobacteriota archaeon]|nr:MAG: hypothetical protein E6K07_05935 [Euryarchaeota archaeon]
MSTQSSQSPLSSAKDNGIPVLILLSLHVSVFLIIAGVLLPTEVDMFTSIGGLRMNAELFLFLFAGLYLLWVLAWGFAPSYGRKLGLALSALAVPFFVLLLAAAWALDVSLPKSGLFIILSLVDSLAIVIVLLILRSLAQSPHSP